MEEKLAEYFGADLETQTAMYVNYIGRNTFTQTYNPVSNGVLMKMPSI